MANIGGYARIGASCVLIGLLALAGCDPAGESDQAAPASDDTAGQPAQRAASDEAPSAGDPVQHAHVWGMEEPNPHKEGAPKDWYLAGPFPYLAHWASGAAASGSRSLTIQDQDGHSMGAWVTWRKSLKAQPDTARFSFALRPRRLKGDWQVTLNWYKKGGDLSKASLFQRVKASLRSKDDGLQVTWIRGDKESATQLDQRQLRAEAAGENGFYTIERTVDVPEWAKGFRVTFVSDWAPSGTGQAWLDDVALRYEGQRDE